MSGLQVTVHMSYSSMFVVGLVYALCSSGDPAGVRECELAAEAAVCKQPAWAISAKTGQMRGRFLRVRTDTRKRNGCYG